MKDEAANLLSFVQQFENADHIVLLDTGSSDTTFSQAKALAKKDERIQVQQSVLIPFNFSIARNMSLEFARRTSKALGIYMWVDLDERLEPDWYQKLVQYFIDFDVNLDTPSYFNTTMLFDVSDTSVNMSYTQRKIHTGSGFTWKHACHEILTEITTVIGHNTEIQINHLAQKDKKRNYLPLLVSDLEEHPHNLRSVYYLGREYSYLKDWNKALETLSLTAQCTESITVPQIVEALLLQADCFNAIDAEEQEEITLMVILGHAPNQIEACLRLAHIEYSKKNIVSTLHWAIKGLQDTGKNVIYNKTDQLAWHLYDLAAIGYDTLGESKQALVCYVTILDSYSQFLDSKVKERIKSNIAHLTSLGISITDAGNHDTDSNKHTG
jgi:glycosyltransferase involved in cell wall biosynthesis